MPADPLEPPFVVTLHSARNCVADDTVGCCNQLLGPVSHEQYRTLCANSFPLDDAKSLFGTTPVSVPPAIRAQPSEHVRGVGTVAPSLLRVPAWRGAVARVGDKGLDIRAAWVDGDP